MDKTHIEISADNLNHNLREFFRITGKPLMFVVKANAYGHGIREVVKAVSDLEFIQYFAVDSLDEALQVKEADDRRRILVLGYASPEDIRDCIRKGFEFVIPSPAYLSRVRALAGEMKRPARIQIKVETGTSRLGMSPAEALECLRSSADSGLEITGVYSHYANIEDTLSHDYAREQLEKFRDFLGRVNTAGLLQHFSCSAAALLFPETYFDLVRVGISAYGMWPSRETYISYFALNKKKIELKPVLSWHSRVAQVKELPAGQGIGYGVTYRTFAPARVAIVPVGYYDGYDRRLSNAATVLIRGRRAPVRGRVCMNMIIVEVTHIPDVVQDDMVTLIGGSGKEQITADYLAEIAGTIHYEILSRIGSHIPRKVR
jgi:alanine racemase